MGSPNSTIRKAGGLSAPNFRWVAVKNPLHVYCTHSPPEESGQCFAGPKRQIHSKLNECDLIDRLCILHPAAVMQAPFRNLAWGIARRSPSKTKMAWPDQPPLGAGRQRYQNTPSNELSGVFVLLPGANIVTKKAA